MTRKLLIAGVAGYMAGLIGASNSPISGIGILGIVSCASVVALAVTPTPENRWIQMPRWVSEIIFWRSFFGMSTESRGLVGAQL